MDGKNCWWLAKQAGHRDPQAMQRLHMAAWNGDEVCLRGPDVDPEPDTFAVSAEKRPATNRPPSLSVLCIAAAGMNRSTWEAVRLILQSRGRHSSAWLVVSYLVIGY